MRTKKALVFKLSNRLVQVDFFDKTQIVINPKVGQVSYRNKIGDKSTYVLENALNINYPEMVKRLKYAKEVLGYIQKLRSMPERSNQYRLSLDP